MPPPNEPARDLRRLEAFVARDAQEVRSLEAIARDVVNRRAFGLDPAERDDLVQETMAQLWAACTREDFRLGSTLEGLVRTIAAARCIDHFRRRRWQQEIDEALPADTDDPLDTIDRERLGLAVRKAVESLRPLCRELIRRHFEGGERYEDMARSMDKAASTLRVHMFRCMRQLRVSLGMESGSP